MKMLPLAIALCIVISFSAPAFAADPWSKQDIILEVVWQAVNIIDYGQTRWMAKNNWQWDGKNFHEENPVLGKHPSRKKVDALYPIGALAHFGITHFLPSNLRPYWQVGSIAVSAYCVFGNDHLGAGLNFSF